jgi:hypothetical protein
MFVVTRWRLPAGLINFTAHAEWPVVPALWGGRRTRFQKAQRQPILPSDLIGFSTIPKEYMEDQEGYARFLANVVHPKMMEQATGALIPLLVHDVVSCLEHAETTLVRPFPTQRRGPDDWVRQPISQLATCEI